MHQELDKSKKKERHSICPIQNSPILKIVTCKIRSRNPYTNLETNALETEIYGGTVISLFFNLKQKLLNKKGPAIAGPLRDSI
jgi:hypothetical protein